jgi:hypothetical protein
LAPFASAFSHTPSNPGNASRQTRGTQFIVKQRGASITGGYFYTGETGSHTVAISLWAVGTSVSGHSDGDQLATVDATVTGPGLFAATFASAYSVADADVGHGEFRISFCEKTAPSGAPGFGDTYGTATSEFVDGIHHVAGFTLQNRRSYYTYPGNNVYPASVDSTATHFSPVEPVISYALAGGW